MPVLLVFTDLLIDERANAIAADFVRAKIRETVQRPGVAELLVPRDFPIGAKRLCQDEGYFETFNRDDVTLVDVRADADRGDHADGPAHRAAASTSSTSIVFATGLRRPDRRAAGDRHPRARRA